MNTTQQTPALATAASVSALVHGLGLLAVDRLASWCWWPEEVALTLFPGLVLIAVLWLMLRDIVYCMRRSPLRGRRWAKHSPTPMKDVRAVCSLCDRGFFVVDGDGDRRCA